MRFLSQPRGSGSCLPGFEVRQVASLIVHVNDLLITLLVELVQLAPGLGVDSLVKGRVEAVPGHGGAARQAGSVVSGPDPLQRPVAPVKVRQRLIETLGHAVLPVEEGKLLEYNS